MANTHFRRWGVVYFLVTLWLSFLATHGWLEWKVGTYPSEDEVPWALEWARSTMENLQSEVFQIALACLVVDAAIMTGRWFQAKND